ncbi:MAG: hypothetical protein RLZZ200_1827, partial [Pseudomonadota bacterium]
SGRELQDALLLAGAALVVWPLLPVEAVDPWGVLIPGKLWRFVVLVMSVGMLGHVALRAVGSRWGFPVAGFFAGFASSTAAIIGFGHRVRNTPSEMRPAVGAAMLANLAALTLIAGVVGAGSPAFLTSLTLPFLACGVVLFAGGLMGLHAASAVTLPAEPPTRSFRISHALLLAVLVGALLLLSAWLQKEFGSAGALVAACSVALAEIHAATASLAQLQSMGALPLQTARLGMVAVLASASIAKTIAAFVTGGVGYGVRVGLGLVLSTLAAAVVAVFTPG